MKRLTALGAGLLVLACAPNRETPTQMQVRIAQESDVAKTAIAAVSRKYERWTAGGYADSIASAFTEGGRQMPPNAPANVGRDAIKAYEGKLLATYDLKLSANSQSVVANGSLAVERGTYQLQGGPKPGAPKGSPMVNETGKYLLHWELVNGAWQVADEIWNTDAPAAPAAAPAKSAAKKAAAKPAAKTPARRTTKKK
jgi:ketosteroid isomerase-like protein